MTKKISSAILFLLLAFCVKSAVAQITIAPIMLFLDQQNRFGTVMIMNGSQQAQEVSIEFPFGYPTTTKNGNIEMVYNDSTTASKWGIEDAVRGFPKNFTLQPGQRQVVRLTVRPKDFQDGMYWSRIRTTSNPQSPSVGETSGDEITTRITYKFEQITTVFYKHGDVNTGIDIQNITTEQNSDVVNVIADVKRTGNAPFLGSIKLTVKDQQGNVVTTKQTSTSIYFDYRQVFKLEENELTQGKYNAEISFISQRTDVPQSDLVQMQPVTQSINFTVK